MEKSDYVLFRSDLKDLKFTGVLIAEARDDEDRGRRREMDLYQVSKTGHFVCAHTTRTCWDGESTDYVVKICKSHSEIIDFFGLDDLAKTLYHNAKIDCVEEV